MRKLVARGAVTTSELEGQEATVAQAQARVDAARYELSCAPWPPLRRHRQPHRSQRRSPGQQRRRAACIWTSWQNCGSIWRCPSATSPAAPRHGGDGDQLGLADQSFSGVLETLDSRISSDTQNIKARVILPNTGGQLRPGMLMNVDLSCHPRR